MKPLSRRTVTAGALAAVTVVPAAAACASVPAVAHASEDAKLVRLWDQWKAQNLALKQEYGRHNEIEEKVIHRGDPVWTFAKLDCVSYHKTHVKYRAVFIADKDGDDSLMSVPIKARDYSHAQELVMETSGKFHEQRQKQRRAAERRYGYHAANRAAKRALDRLIEIEEQICETPAEGLRGVAVKMAIVNRIAMNLRTAMPKRSTRPMRPSLDSPASILPRT